MGGESFIKKIADELGCSVHTVFNLFNKFNIPRRTRSQAAFNKPAFSEESKNIISIKNKGKWSWCKGLSKAENPDKVTYGQPKDKHWNWKGGISAVNVSLRGTSEYKLWRTKCMQRDNFTCCECQTRGGYLEVHHIELFSVLIKENKYLFELENGVTLCESCHKKKHQKR